MSAYVIGQNLSKCVIIFVSVMAKTKLAVLMRCVVPTCSVFYQLQKQPIVHF